MVSDVIRLARSRFAKITDTLFSGDALPPSRRALRRYFTHHRLSDLLPWETWDPATRLYHNADSLGIVLECVPATTLSEENTRTLAGIFSQSLPPGTGFQFVLWASPTVMPALTEWARARLGEKPNRDPALPASRREGVFAALARRRVGYLASGSHRSLLGDQPMLIRDYRLMISVTLPKPRQDEAVMAIESAQQLAKSLLGTLQAAGIHARELDADGFVDFVEDILNPRDPGEPKRDRATWDDSRRLAEQAVRPDTAVLVEADRLDINGFDVQCLSVANYPKQWASWNMDEMIGDFFQNVRRYPCPFLLTANVFIPNQVSARQMAKAKSARATQATQSPLARYVPSWHDKKAEWDYVLHKVDEGYTLCKVQHQLVLFSPRGEGTVQANQVRGLLKAKGWDCVIDRYIQIHALLGALPMTLSQAFFDDMTLFRRPRTMLTWTAANLLPVIADWKGMGSPLMQLVSRRGQLFNWDPFANNDGNYNIAVAARSGSGKSFYVQEMAMSLLATGGRAWIIDAGESYKWICQLLDGEYMEFSSDSAICLNPFTHITDWADGIAMLKPLLLQMAFPGGQYTQAHVSILEQALNAVWHEHGTGGSITRVAEHLERSDDSRARDIATHLYPYTSAGMHGRWFEGPANIRFDNPLMVLELSGLNNKPDLQAVILMLLMMRIAQSMYAGDRSHRKICIIDEAWRLLGAGNSAAFIEEGYRVARKYNGSFCTITQGINDYYKSGPARAALENSDWVVLLRQKEESIQQIKEEKRLAMSGFKERALISLRTVNGAYSEMMINGPQGWAVGRLVVDPFAGKLYSTRAQDFTQITRMIEQGLSIEQAVSRLAGLEEA